MSLAFYLTLFIDVLPLTYALSGYHELMISSAKVRQITHVGYFLIRITYLDKMFCILHEKTLLSFDFVSFFAIFAAIHC